MTPSKNFNKKLMWIGILSAIGAIVSSWQTRLFHVTRSGMGDGNHSFCNIGQTFDCTAIEMSPYSEFLGGLPLSGFAIAGYLLILILSIYGFGETYRKNIRKWLLIFTIIAVGFSIAYLAIMLGIIGKLCLICLGVDVINLTLLGLVLSLPKAEDQYVPSTGLNLVQLAGAGAISLVVAFLITKGTNPQDGMKKADMNDIVESALSTSVTPIDIPADVPTIGNPNAPITIVKFSDFQCPACKMAANAIHPLMKRYPNDIKFAFVNFPLDMGCNPQIKSKMHEFACEAAAIAICANQQGKFAEAYDILFEKQKELETGKIADLLSDVQGLDLNALKDCSKLPSTIEKIGRDVALSQSVKIQSTPTFFMNGKKIEGGLPTNLWIEIIDRTLGKK
jgi:protein-disulfide isomerase